MRQRSWWNTLTPMAAGRALHTTACHVWIPHCQHLLLPNEWVIEAEIPALLFHCCREGRRIGLEVMNREFEMLCVTQSQTQAPSYQ